MSTKLKIKKGYVRVKTGVARKGDWFDADDGRWVPCKVSVGQGVCTFFGRVIRRNKSTAHSKK